MRFTNEAHFAITDTKTKVTTYYYNRPFQQDASILTVSNNWNIEIKGSPDLQVKWNCVTRKPDVQTGTSNDVQFILKNNGNAVFSAGGSIIWEAFSRPRGSSPKQISDRLISSGTDSSAILKIGQGIISPNGEYFLWLKPNGDFELSSKSGRSLWNAGTSGKPGVDSVFLNEVGNLIVYASKEKRTIWQSRDTLKYPDTSKAELVIQDTGIVAIMSSGKTVWQVPAK